MDFGFGGFGFQIPNAIDKLKIGALQRANFKLVNCLNDWLRVDAGGSGELAPPQQGGFRCWVFDFGFRILGLGFWILGLGVLVFKFPTRLTS